MNSGLIWGSILVLLGASLVLKSIFNITVPLVRPFFGCVLIYLGLHIMMDPFTQHVDKKTVIFGKSSIKARQEVLHYNVVFGSSTVDLSELDIDEARQLTINTAFGSQVVLINPEIPTKIRINALFSRAVLPNETLLSFGRNVYNTTDSQDSILTIEINVLFGSVDIKTVEFPPLSYDRENEPASEPSIA